MWPFWTQIRTMKKKIAVLPGDGVGPEVMEQTLKVLDAISERYDHQFNYVFADIGAVAIENHGQPLPPSTLDKCLEADGILLGATGNPYFDHRPELDIRPEQGLLQLRQNLELHASLRPVVSYPGLYHLSPLKVERLKNIDILIVRELSGGIYYGPQGKTEAGAYDTCQYNEYQIERVARIAFEQAQQRRKKLTLVDKSNVLATSKLWRSLVQKMGKSYPDVQLDFQYIDNAAMQIMQWPQQFDVILTTNLFGDMLSDEASVLAGSMGLIPSASYGAQTALFEPIHGSFPQATGEDVANPMGAILSSSLMLDHFGMPKEAKIIRYIVTHLLDKGIGTPDLQMETSFSCSQLGDMIAYLIAEEEVINLSSFELHEKVSTII